MPNDPTPQGITVVNEWVDLYAASGITVGEQLLVNCRGNVSVYLAESAAKPSENLEGIELYPTRQYIIDEDSIGLWARTVKATVPSMVIVQRDNVG